MNNGRTTARSGATATPPLSAESLAIEALTVIAGEPDLLSGFLSTTGLDPGSLRTVAKDPRFLSGVLDYLMTDERLILAVAAATGQRPEAIVAACQRPPSSAAHDDEA